MEGEARFALEGLIEPGAERRMGEKPRDLVLVLIGEKLCIVDRDGAGKLLAFADRGFDGADGVNAIAIALRKSRILVRRQMRRAMLDNLAEAHRGERAVLFLFRGQSRDFI